MAVCGLRTILLIICVLELIITVQRQVFDFLGYMWLPIIANFINILLIIFGSFGAVQYITKYLFAYAIWSLIWLVWNIFLICYYSNLGSLNRESGLLSLGTESVSWWETNGWGCQPVWAEVDGQDLWRPIRVDGCFLQWDHVELAQSGVGALFAATALPLAIILAFMSLKKRKPIGDKNTLSSRPAYTIELSPTEATISESSLKPMTPRRVKRRSGSRGNNSSVRRSRRSYRNAGYLASSASLPRDRTSRPTSAHSSYSNFHAARPASYHTAERPDKDRASPIEGLYDPPPVSESVPIVTNRHNSIGRNSVKSGYDVVGPYKESKQRTNDSGNVACGDLTARIDNIARGWDCDSEWQAPPPPAPPYSSHETPPPAPPYTASATPQYEAQAGHYDAQGTQAVHYDTQSTQGGDYDTQSTQVGHYDSQGTRGGHYDTQGTQGGHYDTQGTQCGHYDTQGTQSGHYDTQGNQGGHYDTQGTQGGHYDPQGTQGGHYESQGTQAGHYDTQCNQGQYGVHSNLQPPISQPQYGGHHSPSPAPHYNGHTMLAHQYEAHSNALYGRPFGHGTPMSPGPPAYQVSNEIYTNLPPCQ